MLERVEEKSRDPASADPAEKRSSPRYPFSCAVEVLDVSAKTRLTGRVSDISREGCYIDTISPFAPKAGVLVRIKKDNQAFETKATVVYSQDGMGMGLAFTAAEPEQLRVLDSWLAELRGEEVPEHDAPEATLSVNLADGATGVDQISRSSISELILLLSRKGVLTNSEGHAILARLFK